MICDPSPRPMFISPIVLTRQLLHPSLNLRDPIRMFTQLSRVFSLVNSEGPNSRSAVTNPLAAHSFSSSASSPTLTTPK